MPRLLKKIKNKVKNALHEAEGLVHEAEDVLNDESLIHMAVQKLYDEVKHILQNQKNLDPEVKEAAEGMLAELKRALREDSSHGKLIRHHPAGQYALAEKSIDILFKYQPSLEAAPGLWNQIKAHLNTFIEQISGEKNVFETKGTAFSNSKKLQEYKDNIAGLKDDFETKLEPKESGPKF